MAASNQATKKYRSKWTRIAVEGATTDGRTIERSWIEQMAAQYSRNTYGARLNCEHMRGLWPGSDFGAFGDVLALKAEEADIGGKKKLALLAQIEPTDSLIALNKKSQKIYTSIEVNPEFADTGKAYLVGLAITDSPASLGTEALSFSAQHGTLANRKQDKDNLFSAAEEVELEFEEVTDQPGMFASLTKAIRDLTGKTKEKEGTDAALFSELGEALQGLVTFSTQQAEAAGKSATDLADLQKKFTSLETELNTLKATLGGTADHNQQKRPVATGSEKHELTDC
ncbi:GPO family capsid scaffolding protein [Pseudomonas sp. PDM14]|uniref:GPO family capsid scaffolding protein n=1 Tax=Pseudomonas sp. PDM14 TaxID=2769288 RepID=UPI001781C5D6|nr:GPO family capsid scaffolding protein [Pseudomonas sp. PDM14]MBD9483918.1 GPO family capsid scaffolding protein [Pseudomonas sp. PDM14]